MYICTSQHRIQQFQDTKHIPSATKLECNYCRHAGKECKFRPGNRLVVLSPRSTSTHRKCKSTSVYEHEYVSRLKYVRAECLTTCTDMYCTWSNPKNNWVTAGAHKWVTNMTSIDWLLTMWYNENSDSESRTWPVSTGYWLCGIMRTVIVSHEVSTVNWLCVYCTLVQLARYIANCSAERHLVSYWHLYTTVTLTVSHAAQ